MFYRLSRGDFRPTQRRIRGLLQRRRPAIAAALQHDARRLDRDHVDAVLLAAFGDGRITPSIESTTRGSSTLMKPFELDGFAVLIIALTVL